MNTFSVHPTTREQAKLNSQRAAGSLKWLSFVAILSGLAAVVALFYLFDDLTAGPAWIAAAVSAALCAGFSGLARSSSAGYRYRITVRYSAVWMAGSIVAFCLVVAALGWLLASLGLDRRIVGKVLWATLITGIVIVTMRTASRTTLFMGWFHNLRVGRTTVAWDDVEAIVLTPGAEPGTVAIGVRPRPGANVVAWPARDGDRLADLPARVVVRQSKIDLDALNWAINQSGRTDIDIVDRNAAGERILRRSNVVPGPPMRR